jgi:hypothetical protein
VSDFVEASRKLSLDVFHQKTAINRENLQHSYKKYGLIFSTFKNCFSGDTILLKSNFEPSTKYFSRDTILLKGKLLGCFGTPDRRE